LPARTPELSPSLQKEESFWKRRTATDTNLPQPYPMAPSLNKA
jgi:hypothetical protein